MFIDFFLSGISQGFRIGFKQQLNPFLQHSETVEKYLTEEIALGWVAGPFKQSLVPHAHVSCFRVILKTTNRTNGG